MISSLSGRGLAPRCASHAAAREVSPATKLAPVDPATVEISRANRRVRGLFARDV